MPLLPQNLRIIGWENTRLLLIDYVVVKTAIIYLFIYPKYLCKKVWKLPKLIGALARKAHRFRTDASRMFYLWWLFCSEYLTQKTWKRNCVAPTFTSYYVWTGFMAATNSLLRLIGSCRGRIITFFLLAKILLLKLVVVFSEFWQHNQHSKHDSNMHCIGDANSVVKNRKGDTVSRDESRCDKWIKRNRSWRN